MGRMRATLGAIALLAVTSAAHAGGMAPGTPGPTPKTTGPAISGVLVVDTHPDQTTVVTSAGGGYTEHKAKLASLWLNKGNGTASAIIRLPTQFTAFLGCDLTVTNARFAFDPSKFADNALKNFMPSATVDALFGSLGINLITAGNPVITSISNAVCTPDPENPAGTAPGILSMVVVIQFIQP